MDIFIKGTRFNASRSIKDFFKQIDEKRWFWLGSPNTTFAWVPKIGIAKYLMEWRTRVTKDTIGEGFTAIKRVPSKKLLTYS